MNAQGRHIIVHVWEDDQKPFKQYDADWLPMFVEVKDGKVTRRWTQDAEKNQYFTGSFISAIAPFRSTAHTRQADCANPIAKIVRNIIPPPPAPGLPDDVPDREKVKRIADLEKLVRDQALTINVLRESLRDLERAVNTIAVTAKGEPGNDGRPGLNGSDGADGRQGPAGPPGPAGQFDRATLAIIQTLKDEVAALKSVKRRFVVVTGNDKIGYEILSDLDYESGEVVVLNRDVFVVED